MRKAVGIGQNGPALARSSRFQDAGNVDVDVARGTPAGEGAKRIALSHIKTDVGRACDGR
jgi:hypothetical protein